MHRPTEVRQTGRRATSDFCWRERDVVSRFPLRVLATAAVSSSAALESPGKADTIWSKGLADAVAGHDYQVAGTLRLPLLNATHPPRVSMGFIAII